MKKYTILPSVVIFVLMLFPCMSSAAGIEIGAGFWSQDPSGDIASTPSSSIDKLDLKDDLKYEKEYKPFARFKADLPLFLPNVYVIITPMKFEGEGSKDQNFTFGDTTFTAAAEFESSLKMNMYDVCFYYSLPLLKTASLDKVNLELGLNARVIDFKAEVSGEEVGGTDISESESGMLPVPMLYAGLQANPVEKIGIEAEVRGIAYSSNHFYDITGRVKLKPAGPIFIAGGYRYSALKIDHDDLEVDMSFKGPFAEVGMSF